jgi:hypothetical protein
LQRLQLLLRLFSMHSDPVPASTPSRSLRPFPPALSNLLLGSQNRKWLRISLLLPPVLPFRCFLPTHTPVCTHIRCHPRLILLSISGPRCLPPAALAPAPACSSPSIPMTCSGKLPGWTLFSGRPPAIHSDPT